MTTFLATTALDEFWERDADDLLLLGSWCLAPARKDRWSSLRYRILPCPWNDSRRFDEAAAFTDAVCERVLARTAQYLNSIHGEKRSLRSWRILLGPWLLQTVQTLYDRYVLLRDAAQFGQFRTIGLDRSSYRVPATSAEQIDWLCGDRYNLQLFTQLLESMGHQVPRKRIDDDAALATTHSDGSVVAAALDTTFRTIRAVAGKQIALVEMYADRADQVSLALRSAGKVVPLTMHAASTGAAARFDDRRLGLTAVAGEGSDFERALAPLMPHLLPSVFLEGYRAMNAGDVRADVFASSNGWYHNDAVTFTAARAADRGSRIIAIQHGGGYGIFRHAPIEKHELRISDRMFVWGWSAQDPSHLRDVPAARLSSNCRRRGGRDTTAFENILFVATAHPRYLYRFHSTPVGTQWTEYFDWQRRFFRALPAEVLGRLRYRGYVYDFGHGYRDVLRAEFPQLQDDRGPSASHALRRSRLVVIDHCATGFLESLAMNVPTVLFWDPARWAIRDAAAPYFEALAEAKILFASPEEAAGHLCRMHAQPQPWWSSGDVQAIRKRFVETFATTDRHWERAWTRAFLAEGAAA